MASEDGPMGEGSDDAGARLLVFPEYGAMELAALDPASMSDLQGSLRFVAGLAPQIDAHHRALAAAHDVHILAASLPCPLPDGCVVNRARLFTPGGQMGHQDKIVMTRFERERWGISGGTAIRLFRTAIGLIGISICYDIEFPMIARAQAQAGATLILAPSCTDSMQGYWRVRIGAQARALENQCFVAQAPTVGMAPWSPVLDENYGAAGLFAPPDGRRAGGWRAGLGCAGASAVGACPGRGGARAALAQPRCRAALCPLGRAVCRCGAPRAAL